VVKRWSRRLKGVECIKVPYKKKNMETTNQKGKSKEKKPHMLELEE
jgi:hypothetical protein